MIMPSGKGRRQVFALAFAAASAFAGGRPYEVLYRGDAGGNLCAALPGRLKRFKIKPSLDRADTSDRLEVACKGTDLRLQFFLQPEPASQSFDFRWGETVGAKPDFDRGQFFKNAALCDWAKALMERAAGNAPKHATIHLRNARLRIECAPDARWGTSLNVHLALNE